MFGVYHLTESANILMLSRRLCLETFFDLIFVPVHVVYPSVAILSHIPTQYQAIFVTYHESYNFPFILAKYIARGLQLFAFTDTQTPHKTVAPCSWTQPPAPGSGTWGTGAGRSNAGTTQMPRSAAAEGATAPPDLNCPQLQQTESRVVKICEETPLL